MYTPGKLGIIWSFPEELGKSLAVVETFEGTSYSIDLIPLNDSFT